jgi:branched-chain amino acid transport system substrate-binding protein
MPPSAVTGVTAYRQGGDVRRTRGAAAAAGMLSVALLLAACGGDDSGSQSSGATTTASGSGATTATTAAATTTTAGGSTTSTAAGQQPKTMDEWEALWTKERAAIVKRIKDNHWGKSADGKTLTGPEGWTVDLSKCPANWSDTEGLTDTSIKIGHSLSLSGTYADYGNFAKSIGMLFDYYGKKGLFKDSTGKTRTVDYITKDDGYDAARAIPNVDELIDSDKVFAIWTLGTPATLKVYDKINQRCIPQPLAMTGHTAWGDPVNHPWTSGAPQPTYTTEAILWGAFIEQHMDEFPADKKIKVAALVQSNDFGKLYEDSFRAYLAESDKLRDRVDFFTEKVEASAPTIKDPMTNLAAKNPDVFLSMLAGTQCTQEITEAAENGMKEKTKYLFQPQTCTGSAFINKDKLGGDGSAGDGWWMVSPGLKDIEDPAQQNDAFLKWARQELQARNINPDASANIGIGLNYGWPVVQMLAIAGELDGGLTRSNFILAMRSIDMTGPMQPPGIRMHMDGLKDAYIVEGGVFQKWDAAKQTWVSQGNIIDLDGKAKLCAWDPASSVCR